MPRPPQPPGDTPIARLVRTNRGHLRLTQAQLAERVGMKESSISRIEKGERNPNRDNCVRLARALRLPVEKVLRAAGHSTDADAAKAAEPSRFYAAVEELPLTREEKKHLLDTYRLLMARSAAAPGGSVRESA